jgi:hypothetical protein
MWAPWQYGLIRDAAEPRSRYLAYILRAHWISTSLITAAGYFLLIGLGVIGQCCAASFQANEPSALRNANTCGTSARYLGA